MRLLCSILIIGYGLALQTPLGAAQEEAEPEESTPEGSGMTLDRLDRLIRRIDEDAIRPNPQMWEFVVAERPIMIITDPAANRMRIMTPIAKSEILTEQLLLRLMQANFDSALDARYAIAQDLVWGVFIHPLRELTDTFFLSAVRQVVEVALTFGTTYSSGAMTYGGGDSDELQRQLLEDLESDPGPIT